MQARAAAQQPLSQRIAQAYSKCQLDEQQLGQARSRLLAKYGKHPSIPPFHLLAGLYMAAGAKGQLSERVVDSELSAILGAKETTPETWIRLAMAIDLLKIAGESHLVRNAERLWRAIRQSDASRQAKPVLLAKSCEPLSSVALAQLCETAQALDLDLAADKIKLAWLLTHLIDSRARTQAQSAG